MEGGIMVLGQAARRLRRRLAPDSPSSTTPPRPRRQRPLRVLLVADAFHPQSGDGTHAARALLDHLVDQGHEAVVVAPAPGASSYRDAPIERILSRDRPGPRIRTLLEDYRPDLVHVVSPGWLGTRALKHAHELGIPAVAAQHAPLPAHGGGPVPAQADPARRAAELFAERVAPQADAVVTTCAWMAARVRDLGVAEPFLWHPGVDTETFSPPARDDHLHELWSLSREGDAGVVVGYAGRLTSRETLRPLVGVGRERGVRLVVIGDGPRRDWLADHVPGARFTGELRDEDRARAMASLDVFVHPATDLTCANPVREAAASGLPVVASRVGGAPEVVRDGETGVLVAPGTRSGFADAVQALVSDPERGRMGQAGREAALPRDWSAAAADLFAGAWRAALPSEVTAAVQASVRPS